MHTDYEDILSRIDEEPKWFDEHAVPRFEPFSPKLIANIYADECVLLEIQCQSCAAPFRVAMSTSKSQRLVRVAFHGADEERQRQALDATLAKQVRDGTIHFGDPPNVGCCPAGPTMNSVPVRILQFWRTGRRQKWERDDALEKDVRPGWADEEWA